MINLGSLDDSPIHFLLFKVKTMKTSPSLLADYCHQDLTETCLTSEVFVKGNMLNAKRDTVRLPNGAESYREYVTHPGAVLVIPVLPNGKLVMERQFRYPMRQAYWELPAGKIDPNEPILETGKRELLEETGYEAEHWEYVAELHPCIGYSNEIIHLFLAKGLHFRGAKLDEDEHLEIVEIDLPTLMQAMRQGEIRDGKTMVALFWADKWLSI